jgi:hypothetical protein
VYPNRGVLLLVDELLNASGLEREAPKNVVAILTEIGTCLNRFPSEKLNAVVSTLDPRPLKVLFSQFGRPIYCILMEPLTLNETLQLFPNNMTLALKQCIIDLAGHPRSIQALQDLISTTPNWHLLPYATLSQMILKEFRDTSLPVTPDSIVELTLLGERVPLTQTVLDDLTLYDCINQGFILNNVGIEETSIIPRMSAFQLQLWARYKKQEEEGIGSFRIQQIASMIQKMLSLECNFDWKVSCTSFITVFSNMNYSMDIGKS